MGAESKKFSLHTHGRTGKEGGVQAFGVVSITCSSVVCGYCLIVAIPMASIIGLATTLLRTEGTKQK